MTYPISGLGHVSGAMYGPYLKSNDKVVGYSHNNMPYCIDEHILQLGHS